MSSQTLPAPPKRRRADAERNRTKVLDAARAAFAEHGADAQMEDVARRAGVGVGTVYRHFPTKQALAAALVDEHFVHWVAYARELLDEPDPWRALVRSFEHCAETQEHDRGYATVLAMVAGQSVAQPPSERMRDEVLATTAQLLARAQAAGAVRPDLVATDLPALYCSVASVVQAGVADWRRHLELLLDGLRPQPPAA